MGDRIEKADVLVRLGGEAMIQFVSSLGFAPVLRGREWAFPCPFHDDDDPSFRINLNKNREKGGIFHCFPCGWDGDIFDFVAQTQRLDGFGPTMKFMAQRLGLAKGTVKQGAAPIVQRESSAKEVQILTPVQVDEDWQRCMEKSIDPREACEKMGVRPDALPLIEGCISKIYPTPVMVVAMRDMAGALTSLRFRSLGPKQPKLGPDGEPKLGPDGAPKLRTVRWSLSRKHGATVTHESRSGLMAPSWQWEEPPAPGQTSVVLEGETDLLAGVSMMLDKFGDPPWPVRWYGLPGVGTCHDMLTLELLGPSAILFFDPDAAGQGAVFSHRRRYKDRTIGSMMVDFDNPPKVGLLETLRARGVGAVAAFPPCEEGAEKSDLRDLYRGEWGWDRLEDHIMRTARGVRT